MDNINKFKFYSRLMHLTTECTEHKFAILHMTLKEERNNALTSS